MTRRPRKPRPARKAGKPRRRALVAGARDPIDDFITAGAGALDLKIKKAWMAAVRTHLRVTLEHGARVAEFALPDDSEPAAVFEA
jgi:hypothetical protein